MKLFEIQRTREQAEELLGRDYSIVKDNGFEEGDLVRVVIVREVKVTHQDPNHKFKTITGSRREPNGESILFRVTKVEKSPEGLKDGYCILWWEEVIIVRRERIYTKEMDEDTDKELKIFLTETKNAPYFSTLYDLDMWKDDREELELDLKVLEFIKSHFKFELAFFGGIGQLRIYLTSGDISNQFVVAILLTPEDLELFKKWNNWEENDNA